jgi:hypothetical protein
VKAGRYYVWSGFVDSYGIKYYHGTIEVVPAQSTFGEVSVKVGRAEALHIVGGEQNNCSYFMLILSLLITFPLNTLNICR